MECSAASLPCLSLMLIRTVRNNKKKAGGENVINYYLVNLVGLAESIIPIMVPKKEILEGMLGGLEPML